MRRINLEEAGALRGESDRSNLEVSNEEHIGVIPHGEGVG